jgi:hypothetical protein
LTSIGTWSSDETCPANLKYVDNLKTRINVIHETDLSRKKKQLQSSNLNSQLRPRKDIILVQNRAERANRAKSHKHRSPKRRHKSTSQQIPPNRNVAKEAIAKGPAAEDLADLTGEDFGGVDWLGFGLVGWRGFIFCIIIIVVIVIIIGRVVAVNEMIDEPQAPKGNGHGGKCEAHASP